MEYRCAHAPLHSPQFHQNAHTVTQELIAQHGPIFPAELAPGVRAWVVADYATITAWCRDAHTFVRDSRLWKDWRQGRVGDEAPIMAMMGHRPNLLYADGAEHDRLKRAIVDCLGRIPEARWGESTRRHADRLIDSFSAQGRADLVADYARILPLLVLADMFGFDQDIGERVLTSITDLWDGHDIISAGAEYERALSDAVSAAHAHPGQNVTSWLLEHRAGLSDEEMLHQLVVTLGAGAEPTANLITSSMHRLLTDTRTSQAVGEARVSVEELVDQVLWSEPPITNYPVLYPRYDIPLSGGRTIGAGEPVLLGYAAAHRQMRGATVDLEVHNRAHLAFGVGPHRCPAQGFARSMAEVGIDRLWRRLPHLRAVSAQPIWRTSPFARALAQLPVTFTPEPPKGPSWDAPSSEQATSTNKAADSATSTARSSKWKSLVAWLFGR